ncbi:zinc metalloprotease HtpX [Betaproteobacteria bacterium]|nr:zinc metalloprotease HtpX [Betaproteobacteria bacterium]
MMGYFKTFFLMTSIICLFVFTGYSLGGETGLVIALILGILSNIFAYWYSDKVILSMYKAKLVNQNDSPELIKIVSELTTNAGMPVPAIYIIEEDSPNAFATGRNPSNAAIAVTKGLIEKLTQNELKGVVAHELAHILNRDILIATVSAVFAAAISSIASFALIFGGRGVDRPLNPILVILLAFVTPIAATIIQMAISRSREYEADRIGAIITKDPASLASALKKIDDISRTKNFNTVQQHPETAQMMIISPLIKRGFKELFSTHPSTSERVIRLNEMANISNTIGYTK